MQQVVGNLFFLYRTVYNAKIQYSQRDTSSSFAISTIRSHEQYISKTYNSETVNIDIDEYYSVVFVSINKKDDIMSLRFK